MIGTSIRGIRHLYRLSDFRLQKILVRCGDYGFDICEVIKSKKLNPTNESMFIFNGCYNQASLDYQTIFRSCINAEDALKITHPRVFEVKKDKANMIELNQYFSDITLLPDTFDSDYEEFTKENAKMFKNIAAKYGLPKDQILLMRLYVYTNGSKNFFQWAVDAHMKYGCSVMTIYNILLWKEYYGHLASKLSKGTITAYKTQDEINNLLIEMSNLRNDKRVNDAINLFNTAQKKILRSNELSTIDKKTLAKFSKLSDVKKNNFIKKVSTIEDFNELMRQMRHATSIHFEWNKESFMDFLRNVEGIQYDIIYENDSIVLVKVNDYDTIKQLAKTTNWCISKNKSYWNNYISSKHGKAVQYMIFNFSKLEDDKLSIIGFTSTHNKGITAAHNFINDTLLVGGEEMGRNIFMLKSYLSNINSQNGIYGILKSCGIDSNLIATYDRPQYEWNYDSLMAYLYECVEKEHVYVIKHEGDKLVLSVQDENIRYFFGDSYIDNVSSEDYYEQHIIFVDFSKNQYDPNKVMFSIIHKGCDEDYANPLCDERGKQKGVNFNAKLIEFGLPYDTIRRSVDYEKIAASAFAEFDVITLKECLKKDKNILHKLLKKKLHKDTIYTIISDSISEYVSFDYLDLIYDSGHTLFEYLDQSFTSDILKARFSRIKEMSRRLYRGRDMELPSEERINAFYNGDITNVDDIFYIGSYLALKKIIENEKSNSIYSKLINSIYSGGYKGGLVKDIMYSILKKIDMNKKNESSSMLMAYFMSYGDDEMKHTVEKLSERYSWLKQALKQYEAARASISNPWALNSVSTVIENVSSLIN